MRFPGWVFRRSMSAALGIVGLLMLAGCASNVATTEAPAQPPVQESGLPAEMPAAVAPDLAKDKIRIALLLPLTGRSAELGASMLDAAQVAVFDHAGPQFELLPKDTGDTPEGAAQAARAAIAEGARLILGPLFAASVPAVRDVAKPAGISVISFSNDRSVAGDGAYIMGFVPGDQVRRVVGYAQSRGRSRFAALVPSNAYGSAVTEAFPPGSLVQTERYEPGAADLTPVVKSLASYESRRAALEAQKRELAGRTDEASRRALERLSQADTVGDVSFDAVMLADSGDTLRQLASLLPYYNIDTKRVQVLGTGLWDDTDLGREPALMGGWYAAPAPEQRASFEQRFESLYGRKPPRLATLAYDATSLAAVLARSYGANYDAATLTNAGGFSGIDGIFRFQPSGIAERGLAILEATSQGPRVLDPAPQKFEVLGY